MSTFLQGAVCSRSCLSQQPSLALLKIVSASLTVGSCGTTDVSGNKHFQWPAGRALADAAQYGLYLWLCTLLAPSACCAPESCCPSLQSCFPDNWTLTHTDAKPVLPPRKRYIYILGERSSSIPSQHGNAVWQLLNILCFLLRLRRISGPKPLALKMKSSDL